MTGLEAFKDVLYILSAVSNNEIDTNCETIKTIEKELKALEIIKKYFNITLEDSFDDYKMLSIQAWSDLDTWDTTAYESIKDEKEIEILKEVLE